MVKKMWGIARTALIFVIAMSTWASAETLSREIPPELARWRAWVLHGHEEALCPGRYNDGAMVRCQWPSHLQIVVNESGGRFEQQWQIFAPTWVSLPGNSALWPQDVVAGQRPVAVMDRNQTPSVYLTPGIHRIKGRFFWNRPPEMIQIPPESGLLSLSVGGQRIDTPVLDAKGRLWLQKQSPISVKEDRVAVRIFRMINDAIPMQITTLVRMDVSGKAREISLEGVLLPDAVPMKLDARLPVRLDKQGQLLVQARPGRWQVRITTRLPDSVEKIAVSHLPYGEEIWSFQPRHELRMVEISGAPQIEPGQTEVPGAWRRYAAYLIKAPTTLMFNEIRRGDPDPPPDQLTLHRRWWLDFDGKGFTLHDRVEGAIQRQWYLAVTPPMVLGRVSIDGKDQVITAQGEDKRAGVALRRGHLNLQSDARMPKRTVAMGALGWDHDFKKVSGQLHLPPGWRLLAAPGVDRVSDTWIQRWSLLDFFLVLIIALAVYKLRNWQWGLLALGAMILIFHEPGAPRLVWLHILAALALMPLLPAGWLKHLVAAWGIAAGVFLLITVIPFVSNQMRWGIYPQLAPHNQYAKPTGRKAVMLEKADNAVMAEPDADASPLVGSKARPMAPTSSLNRLGAVVGKAPAPVQTAKAIQQQDPDALIPTGPGLPDWHWHTISLGWSGPVAKDQSMRLYLISPMVNLILAILRVTLLVGFIWGLFDWSAWIEKFRQKVDAKAVAASLLLMGLVVFPKGEARAQQAVFPPTDLLDTYRERLLAPADCLPHCADISRLELAVSDDVLQMMLKVHAAQPTAIPLPVNRQSWTPTQIILDKGPVDSLARDEGGTLWAVVPPGSHTLILRGSLANEEVVSIPLPLKPHRAGFVAEGWTVKGILPDGQVGSSIQINRVPVKSRDNTSAPTEGVAMQPFLSVERVLHLGLTWQVRTTVRRLTPPGAPIVATVPLLADESVTTAGLQVAQGSVLINMSADQRHIVFTSGLKMGSKIELNAPKGVPWTETWVLDASPIWHCAFSGIAPIHHQDGAGQWQPRWQPWPGEMVHIDIVRPKALEGQLTTIHKAQLTLTPGQRFGMGVVEMQISSSRGGQYAIGLPENTNLQKVSINGKSLPIRQDGLWVTVPLQPGTQTISVAWHQLSAFGMLFRAPELKIGQEAVNAKVTMKLPQRWILMTGGPDWGPAVLFWSYLVVVVVAALGLGRLTLTPLNRWQWLLLGLGLTQIPAVLALLIVGWLLVLGLRERQTMPGHWLGFNALQLGLVFWSVAALFAMFAAVRAGLVGQPEMQIAGNQSNGLMLHWVQDRVMASLPRPWVISLPVWVYRVLMLAWSLWLAAALLGWLKWGWHCLAKDGVWKKWPPRVKKATAASK